MNLTPEQTQALRAVRRARNRVEQAEDNARQAVLDAVAAGVPRARVAEAYGMGRMTLWRRLNSEEER